MDSIELQYITREVFATIPSFHLLQDLSLVENSGEEVKAVTTKLVNGLKDLYDEKEQLIAKEKAGMYKSI